MNELLISNTLSALLAEYGIREVVASPGTRNAPIIAALTSRPGISVTMVVDERSAAFVAIGKATVSDTPVALVCTSGSAILDYAPALAEAYYRHIPVIAISADRPTYIIDRNDGQTIRQDRALANIVKNSFHIGERESVENAALTINDAISEAITAPRGPVHINIAIDNPTVKGSGFCEVHPRKISIIDCDRLIAKTEVSLLALKLSSPRRVMIWAGANPPSQRLNKALTKISGFGNFVVISEIGSNLHFNKFITSPDTLLIKHDFKEIAPDILLTFGQPLLSSRFKHILSKQNIEHWHIGYTDRAADIISKLSLSVKTDPESFFCQLAATMRRCSEYSSYSDDVARSYNSSLQVANAFIKEAPWCDITALKNLISAIPKEANIQISNGMSVRYMQLLNFSRFHRTDYNRGVSGIDGCTSSAIGASTAYSGMTVLISGDMSARYDIGALGLRCVSPKFKMVVICNNGGQIFRNINPTREFDALETYMCENEPAPFSELAAAWGYRTFKASSETELNNILPQFISETEIPALLELHTGSSIITEVMTNFYKL